MVLWRLFLLFLLWMLWITVVVNIDTRINGQLRSHRNHQTWWQFPLSQTKWLFFWYDQLILEDSVETLQNRDSHMMYWYNFFGRKVTLLSLSVDHWLSQPWLVDTGNCKEVHWLSTVSLSDTFFSSPLWVWCFGYYLSNIRSNHPEATDSH